MGQIFPSTPAANYEWQQVFKETTVAGYLNTQPKPVFREGHTLPLLTRYGWTLGFDARVALARDWGYALE